MDGWLARLSAPRFGTVFLTAVVSLLMSLHWLPMAVPAAVVIALAVVRPSVAVRPVVWWVMAGAWAVVATVLRDRMEDHVSLFAVWLVALAISLARDDDDAYVDQAAWQARVLVGVTFTAAVAWKLYFSEFATGMILWLFILIDRRFEPLARVVGLSDAGIERDRSELAELLAGTVEAVTLDAPAGVVWRIVAVAALALVVEAIIAVSHLVGDARRFAALRVPSVVVFAVMTYAVVPVIPFAALLGVLTMAAARWRRAVLWVFPVVVLVGVIRLALLQ